MKYSSFLTVLCLSTVIAHADNQTKQQLSITQDRLFLESDTIPLLDGFFIDAQRIANMMKLRKELVEFLYGKSQNNTRIGMFNFEGENYTFEQLCTIEQNAYLSKNLETIKNLKATLREAKDQLKEILGSYARQARGAKSLLVILIAESLAERKIERSILKNWALVKDGEEKEQLEKDLVDLCACKTLCTHLIRFLQDLMFSCKKAFTEYRKQVQQHVNRD